MPVHKTDESLSVRSRRNSGGFSLIEIVLALGVVSFAVVALMGLLTVSAGTSRSSDEDTVIAAMTRQVLAELRSIPFSLLTTDVPAWAIKPDTDHPWPLEPEDAGISSLPPTYTLDVYFDNEAHRLDSAAGAIYQCTIKVMADPNTLTYSPDPSNPPLPVRTNLYRVQLAFYSVDRLRAQKASPTAPAIPPIQTIRTSVARND